MAKIPKKQPNKYLALTGIAFQMGITIYLFTYLGKWLDTKYPHHIKIYTLILSIVGVVISLYVINKQLQNIDKK